MKLLIGITLLLFVSFSNATNRRRFHPLEKKLLRLNKRLKELEAWISHADHLISVLSIPVLGETATPALFAQRNLTMALQQQTNRWRGYVVNAMAQATGQKVSVCPPIEISDNAVDNVRKELELLGFHIQWNCPGDLYNANNPISSDLENYYKAGICSGQRQPFEIFVPTHSKEK
jgi:hypothetical protein